MEHGIWVIQLNGIAEENQWKKLVVLSASRQMIDQIIYISFFFTHYFETPNRYFLSHVFPLSIV